MLSLFFIVESQEVHDLVLERGSRRRGTSYGRWYCYANEVGVLNFKLLSVSLMYAALVWNETPTVHKKSGLHCMGPLSSAYLLPNRKFMQ